MPPDAFVADIGGTNLRIATAYRRGQPETASANPQTLVCRDYDDIVAALREGLRRLDHLSPRRGAIAIAGPVTLDSVTMTNGPWTFSIDQLTHDLGLDELRVVNDLEALAHALPHLDPEDLEQIGGKTSVESSARVVVASGTGLGISGLLATGDHVAAISGEGGHVDFAPANQREIEIWRWFADRHDHVSVERILSGPGLADLYRALADVDESKPAVDPIKVDAQAIVGLVQAEHCLVALAAARDFSAILGAVAGDLALTLGARGGVYLAGGVLTGLGYAFDRPAFRQRFENKGRFRDYLRPIPCYLIRTLHPALTGLAHLLNR